MNRFNKAIIQGGLWLSVCSFATLPLVLVANEGSSVDHSSVENTVNEYMKMDSSGIYRIQHTAYAVIHLKKILPPDARFFLNGKTVTFQNVDTTGLVLKVEVRNLGDTWLEVRSAQGSIHQLLTLKNG
ncbi:hypothetical protein [Zooshikella ganghwensis]|uniref:hypothetical protein n=1 Tax=Zooshikella ganghwensis TaxID=202772 RepID=UPI0003F859D4|nr:hypothetical protein [Zooshikella ganghwensis]